MSETSETMASQAQEIYELIKEKLTNARTAEYPVFQEICASIASGVINDEPWAILTYSVARHLAEKEDQAPIFGPVRYEVERLIGLATQKPLDLRHPAGMCDHSVPRRSPENDEQPQGDNVGDLTDVFSKPIEDYP